MDKGRKRFWASVYAMIGSTIGVGVFSIPYVLSQSGVLLGMVWMIGVAGINVIALLMYAEVLMFTPGNSRISGLAGRYIGPLWKYIAAVLSFMQSWGAMIGYIVIGGLFLSSIVGAMVPMQVLSYQVLFGVVLSAILFGGLGFVARAEQYLIWMLLAVVLVMFIAGIPQMNPMLLLAPGNPTAWFLPFGPLLFAFGSFSAIPEASEILGKDRALLRRTVLVASTLVFFFYSGFALATIMISGAETSVEAIEGLAYQLGNWFLIAGSIMGLLAVSTSFILLGISIMDGFLYDFKFRYVPAWALTITVPMGIFLLGARDFIKIVSITGAVFGGAVGLLILYIYAKAHRDMCLPKRCLSFPRFTVWILATVYLVGMTLELFFT